MSVLRNSLANFLGGVLPALVMLVTVPLMVSGLGLADYGMLTLITAITGYFSIMDINLTAGSVKFVAEYRALGDSGRESETIVLGLLFYLVLGIVGAGALYTFAMPLADRLFSIPAAQQPVAAAALRVAAVGFLLGQIQQYLNSLPQAIQRYDASSKLESLFGVVVPIASVLALQNGAGLVEVVEIRVAGSAIHLLALAAWCRKLFPELRLVPPSREIVKRVTSFSAFAYLGKLAALTYAHADKLIIGAVLGVEAVTIYAVPATLVNRFLALTFRLSSVVFPATSQLAATGQWSRLEAMYLSSTKYITYLNGVIVLLIVLFGQELLAYWVGGAVAAQGYWVLLLTAFAMFCDSLTNLPSLVNDGLGHVRVSGLFAIARGVLGLALTWGLAQAAGINGVAIGHLLASVILGTAFIFYAHGRTVPYRASVYLRDGLGGALLAVGGPGLLMWILRPDRTLGSGVTLSAGALCAALFILIGWKWILLPRDRREVMQKLRSRSSGPAAN